MAEQAAENNCYTIVRKKWQSWLRQQNCYSIYKKIAELAAPTKLLYDIITYNFHATREGKSTRER